VAARRCGRQLHCLSGTAWHALPRVRRLCCATTARERARARSCDADMKCHASTCCAAARLAVSRVSVRPVTPDDTDLAAHTSVWWQLHQQGGTRAWHHIYISHGRCAAQARAAVVLRNAHRGSALSTPPLRGCGHAARMPSHARSSASHGRSSSTNARHVTSTLRVAGSGEEERGGAQRRGAQS
jgi:hypothetical protein